MTLRRHIFTIWYDCVAYAIRCDLFTPKSFNVRAYLYQPLTCFRFALRLTLIQLLMTIYKLLNITDQLSLSS